MGKVPQVTVGGYWINHISKHCKRQTTLDRCDDLVRGFADMMASLGHKVEMIRSEDKASPLQWSAWADKNPGGVDTVDFSYLATHGATYGHEYDHEIKSGSKWVHWFWFPVDSSDVAYENPAPDALPEGPRKKGVPVRCYVATLKWHWVEKDQHHLPNTPITPWIVLGDGRLRWATLDCCMSLQIRLENLSRDKDLWNEQEFETVRTELAEARPDRTWGWCLDGVHMLFGFTGLSSDAWWTAWRGKSFGQRVGMGETLADSWLDEAYSHAADDAPVVLACGRSGEDSDQRLMTESLAAVAPTLRASEIGAYTYMWRS